MVLLVVLLLLLAGVLGFLIAQVLSDDEDDPGTTTTTTTEVDGATPAPAAPGTVTPPGGSGAPCTGDAVLAGLGGSVQGIPVMVTDVACTTATPGYAWAVVVPADPTVVADPLTVYLADVGGVWQSRSVGTGISCTGSGLPADACAELP